jgi:hypothetical protein
MRLRALGACVVVIVLALGAIDVDAAQRRSDAAEPRALRARLVAATGLPDLALSSGARWLRHPSQVEPAAAISDTPGALDVDPAGGWIAPPRAVITSGARGSIEIVDPRRRGDR